MPPSPVQSRRAEPHSVGYTMGAIVLIVSMVGLSAAYGLGMLLPQRQSLAPPSDDGSRVEQTLVGKELDIPASWFPNGTPKNQGFATRIDFELILPLGKK